MRVVVDTNILVSALLKPASHPGRILDLIVSGQLTLLIDHRILYEYREVLRRPKFDFEEGLVDELISFLDRFAEYVTSVPLSQSIPDPDDLPFFEVALSGKADALITGNARDYGKPPKGLKILTAERFLKGLEPLS